MHADAVRKESREFSFEFVNPKYERNRKKKSKRENGSRERKRKSKGREKEKRRKKIYKESIANQMGLKQTGRKVFYDISQSYVKKMTS